MFLRLRLQRVCQTYAASLSRFKGVLWCVYQGKQIRVVLQGTYGQFEWSDSQMWAPEELRRSRLVRVLLKIYIDNIINGKVFIGAFDSATHAELRTALSAHKYTHSFS